MYDALILGNELITLEKVDSTNSYIKKLFLEKKNLIEGLVVVTKDQTLGRGQMGNKWLSEPAQNLTFSILLKSNLKIENQFILSKLVSLGILDFLKNRRIKNVKIKWPNDIYVDNFKIAGILIENTLKGKNIDNSILGIGLNVNQINFDSSIKNVSSMKLIQGNTFDLEILLKELLFFIEKRYVQLKSFKYDLIDNDYLTNLYLLNEPEMFEIDSKKVQGMIIGVTTSGMLKIKINELVKEFNLKEVKFIV